MADQYVRTNRRPGLDAKAVAGRAVQSPQSQVLFDPTKEQLDGPAAAENLRDHQSLQLKLVVEKDQRKVRLRIHATDSAQLVGIVLPADEGIEFDDLIGAQARGLVNRTTFRNPISAFQRFSFMASRRSRCQPR